MRNLIPLLPVILWLSAPWLAAGEANAARQQAEQPATEVRKPAATPAVKNIKATEMQKKQEELDAARIAELSESYGFPESLSPAVRKRLIQLLEKRKDSMGYVSVLLSVTHYDLTSSGNSASQAQLEAITRRRRTSTSLTGRSRRGPINGLSGTVTYQDPNPRVIGNVGSAKEGQNRSSANQTSIMISAGKPSYIAILKRTSEVWTSRIAIPPARGREKGKDGVQRNDAGRNQTRVIENVVGTGLRVQLKAASKEAILMELCPYYRVKVDGSRRRTRRVYVDELKHTLVTIPGLPVTLSSYGNRRDDRFSSIFSNVKEGGKRSFKTVLRTDIHIQRLTRP